MTTGDDSRTKIFNMRLTEEELQHLHEAANRRGFPSTSEFLRSLALADINENSESGKKSPEYPKPSRYFHTKLGSMYLGDSLGLLHSTLAENSVDLIVTSPPFGLLRPKEYGNSPAGEYLSWFKPFAAGIKRVLKPNGSLVIDIGPAWNKGVPTKSLYQFELLTMLCREYGFHLAQDFYWWNPCRMPAPAEWVNVRRLRAKDAVNPVWWLSPSPWPKASNRRVLTSYGKDQEKLFRNGYNAGKRPSGHVVSTKWNSNNGGAIPPNLIAAPNTVSDDPYQLYCRENGIDPHPARFPWALPEFFIRMLTDRGDFVVDPFGGSCLTGAVSEHLGRRWACGEIIEDYLEGALGRFADVDSIRPPKPTEDGYRVPVVSAANGADGVSLPQCGGKDVRLNAKTDALDQSSKGARSSSSISTAKSKAQTPRKRS